MTDDNDFDRQLNEAFESRSGGVHVDRPDIDDLVARGQQTARRTLVAGSLCVLAFGAVGVAVFAGSGGSGPQDALDDSLPPVDLMASTTVATGQPTWSCVGPLGTSPDGAVAYYESCSPAGGSSPYPATASLGTVTTIACESLPTTTIETTIDATVEPTTILPFCGQPADIAQTTTTSIVDGTFVPVCTIPGCGSGNERFYTVRAGDYPLAIAQEFCTTLSALVELNDWSSTDEFPAPGTAIVVGADAAVTRGDGEACPDPQS